MKISNIFSTSVILVFCSLATKADIIEDIDFCDGYRYCCPWSEQDATLLKIKP